MAVKILGDLAAGDLVRFSFNTVGLNSAPITLVGVSAQSHFAIKKDGSDMILAADTVTVSVDAGSVTGYHVVTVDTTKTGFDAGSDYEIRLTAGTIDSISHVGAVLATWSLENRTTALRDGTITANTFDTGVLATDADIADALLDEPVAEHSTAGSLGALVASIDTAATGILLDTGTTGVLVAEAASEGIGEECAKALGIPMTLTGTPTTTSLVVDDAPTGVTTTQIDNALVLHLASGAYSRITAVSGTAPNLTLTVSPALPAAPADNDEIVVYGQYLASLS